MTLNEIENYISSKMNDVKFPKKFHELHDIGIMEWLERSEKEFSKNIAKYMSAPETFMFSLSCDCELLRFDEIKKRTEELCTMLDWRRDDKKEVPKGAGFFPFAHTAGGDLFCFFYDKSNSEPMIFQYYHDCYDEPMLCGRDFDEFLYFMMLEAVDWGGTSDDVWYSHLNYLAPEYRLKLDGKSNEQLKQDYEDYSLFLGREVYKINIFEKIY